MQPIHKPANIYCNLNFRWYLSEFSMKKRLNPFQPFQSHSDLFRPASTSLNPLQPIWISSNLFKSVQTYLNPFQPNWIRSNPFLVVSWVSLSSPRRWACARCWTSPPLLQHGGQTSFHYHSLTETFGDAETYTVPTKWQHKLLGYSFWSGEDCFLYKFNCNKIVSAKAEVLLLFLGRNLIRLNCKIQGLFISEKNIS